MAELILGEIVLRESTKLIFSVNGWKGRQFASVRKYIETQRYKGWSKSGLLMNLKLLREVTAGLSRLENSIPPLEQNEFERLHKNDTEHIKIVTLPSDIPDELPAVDVREFVDSPAYQGPTKRGFRFRWDLLPDVIACLQEQIRVMREVVKNEPMLFRDEQSSDPKLQIENQIELPHQNGLAAMLGEELKDFPCDFLDASAPIGRRIHLPEGVLWFEQDNAGGWILRTEEGFFTNIRNPAEGNFILYAQMRGHAEIDLPSEMIDVFKAAKSYENYVRGLQKRISATLMKRTKQRSLAMYEAKKKCKEYGVPWLLG